MFTVPLVYTIIINFIKLSHSKQVAGGTVLRKDMLYNIIHIYLRKKLNHVSSFFNLFICHSKLSKPLEVKSNFTNSIVISIPMVSIHCNIFINTIHLYCYYNLNPVCSDTLLQLRETANIKALPPPPPSSLMAACTWPGHYFFFNGQAINMGGGLHMSLFKCTC